MIKKRIFQVIVASLALTIGAILPSAPALAIGEVYGPYFIEDLNSGLCLDNPGSSTSNGTTMIIYTCLWGANQKWHNEVRANASYWTFNVVSRKCLAVQNASASDNATILQYTCNDGANERWTYEYTGVTYTGWVDGKYNLNGRAFKIRNVNSGRCLTVKNGSRDSGATLLQFNCDSPGSNIWIQWPI